MTTDLKDKAAVEAKLWAEIGDSRTGMLAPIRAPQDHLQPMTAYPEPESRTLWFYARAGSDLAVTCQVGTHAMFVFVSRDGEMQASIHGELRTTVDELHRDKYWSSTVGAWYPKGKADPQLVMLRFSCADAQIWISEVGGVKFGWEIAKANLTGSRPEIGGMVSLSLD